MTRTGPAPRSAPGAARDGQPQRPAEGSVGLVDSLSLSQNIPALTGGRERPDVPHALPQWWGRRGGGGGDTRAPRADVSEAG